MLRHHRPPCIDHQFVSDSETESDDGIHRKTGKGKIYDRQNLKIKIKGKQLVCNESNTKVPTPLRRDSDPIAELAKEYQKQMKRIPVPRGSLPREIQFVNWQGLATQLKSYFGQPMHYLTHVLCKQWDASRIGSEDEEKPLAKMIILSKAEATIWDVERVHRLCTSHTHLATLWRSDPEHCAYAHQVLPNS